jgi:hypothetical protein
VEKGDEQMKIRETSEGELVTRVVVIELCRARGLQIESLLETAATEAQAEITRRKITLERVTELKAQFRRQAWSEVAGLQMRGGIETTGEWMVRL